MNNQPKIIPKIGSIYRISSRNLAFGVYVGPSQMGYTPEDPATGEFIGLRQKFGSVFLSSEWGRVMEGPIAKVPEGIELTELGPRICQNCGGSVEEYTDPNERRICLSRCDGPCEDQIYAEDGLLDIQPNQVKPGFTRNQQLHDLMEQIELTSAS